MESKQLLSSTPKTKVARRRYDDQFRQLILEQVSAGRPVSEVAQQAAISQGLVYSWMVRARKSAGSPGGTHAQAASLQLHFDQERLTMERRIRELEQERDILKKALAIFSR